MPGGGRGTFRHAALDSGLGRDRGNNVEARWNVDTTTAPAGTTIDIVVYLHGYARPRRDFLALKAREAGLDMVDATGAVSARTSRPTLALMPLGVHSPTHERPGKWVFSNLATKAAFDALVTEGLQWLASNVLGLGTGSLERGRLTLMAFPGEGPR